MRYNLESFHGAMLLVILVLIIATAGCSGYSQPPGSVTTQQTPIPGGNTVAIKNFAFNPATMTVTQGTTVTWVNQDSPEHQIINDASGSNAEGAIFKSNPLPNGASYSFTFNIPGTYPYHCTIHPSMKGIITVR